MCVLSLVYTKVVPVKTCNIFPIPINVIKVPTLIYSICIVELTVRGRSHMIATHNSHSKWHVAFTGLLRALTVLGSNVLGGFSVLKIKGENRSIPTTVSKHVVTWRVKDYWGHVLYMQNLPGGIGNDFKQKAWIWKFPHSFGSLVIDVIFLIYKMGW